MPKKPTEEILGTETSAVPKTAFSHRVAQALEIQREINLIPELKFISKLGDRETDNFTLMDNCDSLCCYGSTVKEYIHQELEGSNQEWPFAGCVIQMEYQKEFDEKKIRRCGILEEHSW